jgi:hypothetical protein
VCKFNFVVDVEASEDGKFDPREHQNYVWATEEELKPGKVDETKLKFTSSEQERIVL